MALLFINKIPSYLQNDFAKKVNEIAAELGFPADWLMGVMELETAGTFDPSITNSIGATGLIQFMPSTAIGLGTTTAALRQMSAIEQLDWVKKYYWPYRSKIKRYVDLYIATLFPAALGKPNEFVLQSRNLSAETIAKANPYFDLNKDRQITVGEIETKLLKRIPEEWINIVLQKKKELTLGGLALLIIAGYLVYTKVLQPQEQIKSKRNAN